MSRERALKILLVLVGLGFLVGAYSLSMSLLRVSRLTPPEEMILAIDVPIGVFLLLAVRHPSANRTLIACITVRARRSRRGRGAVDPVRRGETREGRRCRGGPG